MFKPRSIPVLMASVFGIVMVGIAPIVSAEVLEEIVVTAQKRQQNIQDVPVSITAFSADMLEDMSIQNVGEVINFAPNVSRASGPSSGDDGFFFFRGVGQVDNSANVDPGVGVYVDDVYLGRIQGASFDVLDIERIEILRGPQGTFFGRNTIGGAVSATTKDPGEEFRVKGKIIGGSRDRLDGAVTLDMPLAEGLGMKVTGFTRNQEGWAENIRTGATYGDREDIGGRIKLVWDVSDTLQFKLAGDYTRGQGSPIPTTLFDTEVSLLPPPPGAPPGTPPMPFFGSPLLVNFPADFNTEIDTNLHDDRINSSIPAILDTDRGGISLVMNWDTELMKIKTITAYRETVQDVHTDLDGSSYDFYDFFFGIDQDQFSQEIQLSGLMLDDKLHWLLGGYYFNESVLNHAIAGVGTNTIVNVPFPPFILPGPAARLDDRTLAFNSNLFQDTESWAIFGQFEYDLSERLTGVFGFRYTSESKDVSFDNSSDNTAGIFTPIILAGLPPSISPVAQPGTILYTTSPRPGSQSQILGSPHAFSDSWSEFSPKVGLNYQYDDNIMFYASWSNGFKSGGFPGRATPGNTLESYQPETLETWELGVKSEWLDRRLRVNVAGFITDYTDVQLLIAEVVNGTPQFNTRNAGDVDISGIELEVMARPVANLDLMFGLGWLDNEYTRLDPGAANFGVTTSDSLPNAPEWTWNMGAQYLFELGEYGGLSLRADYNYRSEAAFQAANNPGDFQDGYGLLNIRASYRPVNEHFTFSVFGTNVTDEEYFTSLSDQRFGNPGLGVGLATLSPGAEWGVELGFEF